MATIARIGRLKGPLTITCHACGRSVTWAPLAASRRLGGDCTVREARRRLHCAACGARGSQFVDFH